MKWPSTLLSGLKTILNMFNGFQKSKHSETSMTTLPMKLQISSPEFNLKQMLTFKLTTICQEPKTIPTSTDSCKSNSIGVNVSLPSMPILQLTTKEDVPPRTLWVVDYHLNVILKHQILNKINLKISLLV